MKKFLMTLVVIVIFLIGFSYYENNFITITNYEVKIKNLPSNFDNFKILQISDLHSKEFGKDQKVLVEKVNEIKPDIIVITGDFIDSRDYNETASLKLIEKLNKQYLIFLVSGNHEIASNQFRTFKSKLEAAGVIVLSNENKKISKGEDKIYILGVEDPLSCPYDQGESEGIKKLIETARYGLFADDVKILLSHRPEYFNKYTEYDLDLVLTGHAHGGQIRIPYMGGLYAPGQGFFPRFTDGIFESGRTKMLISRGLGSSLLPQRVFNRPELVVVNLKSENK